MDIYSLKKGGANEYGVMQLLVDPQCYDAYEPGSFVSILSFDEDSHQVYFEYYSTLKEKYFGPDNQFQKRIPGPANPMIFTGTTTQATEAPANTTVATEEEKGGCGSVITSTLAIAGTLGTALATFAMRKKNQESD